MHFTQYLKNESVWRRNSAFYQILNLFSVFSASYHFVSHTKFSVSLYSETSETNLLFRFAHFRFRFASFRFKAKCGDTLGEMDPPYNVHLTQNSVRARIYKAGEFYSGGYIAHCACVVPPLSL